MRRYPQLLLRPRKLRPYDPIDLFSEVIVVSNLVAPVMLKRNSSQVY
jgi:hypothetical protein